MANGEPPGGGGTFKGMPKWVWYAGGGVAVIAFYLMYRARKQSAASQQSQSGSGYTSGAQAGAYGTPLPGAGVLEPIIINPAQSTGSNNPQPTNSGYQSLKIQGQSGPLSQQQWASLASQPQDVQQYLRALSTQTQQTGGWTSVPSGFQGLPPGATLTASGPGFMTYIPPGSSSPITVPLPAASPGSTMGQPWSPGPTGMR
jgi:hypothetical protein